MYHSRATLGDLLGAALADVGIGLRVAARVGHGCSLAHGASEPLINRLRVRIAGSWLVARGSWLVARGSWLVARERPE